MLRVFGSFVQLSSNKSYGAGHFEYQQMLTCRAPTCVFGNGRGCRTDWETRTESRSCGVDFECASWLRFVHRVGPDRLKRDAHLNEMLSNGTAWWQPEHT